MIYTKCCGRQIEAGDRFCPSCGMESFITNDHGWAAERREYEARARACTTSEQLERVRRQWETRQRIL